MSELNPAHLTSFLARPRAEVAALKESFWEQRLRGTDHAAEAFTISDALRRHAKMLQPDWPRAEDRAEDLDAHIRLKRLFERAKL